MVYAVGETVKGIVSGVTDYGAFVRLDDGSTGMIHISKLSKEFISDIHSFIKKGDTVEATVISNENQRIALSLIGDEKMEQKRSRPIADFESMLSAFKTESDKKLSGISKGSQRTRRNKR